MVLWRRLDVPGHDACRLLRSAEGWMLEGSAAFLNGDAPALVNYRLVCDSSWNSRAGEFRGWSADRDIDVRVERSGEGWRVNGTLAPGLEDCADLDFGFTPATNYAQLRRIALEVGESADVRVAWIDLPPARLERLPQHYERRSERTYWYEARRFGYSGLLELDASGFVRRYPELWERVSTGDTKEV